MGIAGLILVPHLSKSSKSFLFYNCTSDFIVISQNSQWAKSCKNTQKPSSPGIQRFLGWSLRMLEDGSPPWRLLGPLERLHLTYDQFQTPWGCRLVMGAYQVTVCKPSSVAVCTFGCKNFFELTLTPLSHNKIQQLSLY